MEHNVSGPKNAATPGGPSQSGGLSRRQFMRAGGVAAATFTIVPRQALGGPGVIAPSEKITLACIGFGSQAIREIGDILASPEVQIVAVCDVEKDGRHYLEWDKGEVRSVVRRILDDKDWREDVDYPPGGRDVGREIVETYYAKQRGAETYKGCATYTDFRELLENEKDVTAVKVMTPDHTHGVIANAALKNGMNVVMHKPLANRLLEARTLIGTAREKQIATHFLPASDGARLQPALAMIKSGAIGALREIHNWSSRPMWPQFATLPVDTPRVPRGFDWDLWLGPSVDRSYHPNYTHTNFRGWYEFGGGPIADMGHYSLWPIFQALDLDAPFCVESAPSHEAMIEDHVCRRIMNDFSFPTACTVRMRFAAKGERGALDIFWYDGGILPRTPEELLAEGKALEEEGMMFVGDQGKIMAGFRGEEPDLIPESAMRAYQDPKATAEPEAPRRGERNAAWIDAFRGGPATYGDFTLAGPISDAMNLAAISLRLGGKRLQWDAASATITNLPEANQFLTRTYRPGWKL